MELPIKRYPAGVITVFDQLEKAGFEGYLVGGCVRDLLLGNEPHDFDFASNAVPEEILTVFKGYKTVRIGEKHGTIAVQSDGLWIEITTFRTESDYADFRHPTHVEFAGDIRKDLARRDFTVNAMAISRDGNVIDLFGGKSDIEKRVIRCVGDPKERFTEDALRIMRALRFTAVLNFEIEKLTSHALHRYGYLLKEIAVERILTEFKILLLQADCGQLLCDYSDVLIQFIPELAAIIGFEQFNPHYEDDVYTHSCKVTETVPADIALRLAAFLHDIAKPDVLSLDNHGNGTFIDHAEKGSFTAKEILTRLKIDKKTIELVCKLISLHEAEFPRNKPEMCRWMNRFEPEILRMAMELQEADLRSHSTDQQLRLERLYDSRKILVQLINDKVCYSLKDLAINGDDLIKLGYSGKNVGKILNHLLEEVIQDRLENIRESLTASLKRAST